MRNDTSKKVYNKSNMVLITAVLCIYSYHVCILSYAWHYTITMPTSRIKAKPVHGTIIAHSENRLFGTKRLAKRLNLHSPRQKEQHKFSEFSGEDDDHNLQHNSAYSGDNNTSSKLDLKLLLVDHYDSFTYNLVDLLSQICVEAPIVRASDSKDLVELVQRKSGNNTKTSSINSLHDIDGIILSPGPGHPRDCVIAQQLLRQFPQLPILGVCLGHQVMGMVYGANVTLSPTPIHGQVWPTRIVAPSVTNQYDNENSSTETFSSSKIHLWHNISTLDDGNTNDTVAVTRYHSLCVNNLPPDILVATSYSLHDRVVMSIQHVNLPHWGVQFHPESIGTRAIGRQILYNFALLCEEHKQKLKNVERKQEQQQNKYHQPLHFHKKHENLSTNTHFIDSSVAVVHPVSDLAGTKEKPFTPKATTFADATEQTFKTPPYQVYVHKVSPSATSNIEPLTVMEAFFKNDKYSFWLDHARQTNPNCCAISVLGASDQRFEYFGKEKARRVQGLHFYKKVNNMDDCEYRHDSTTSVLNYLHSVHCKTTNKVTFVEFDTKSTEPKTTARMNVVSEANINLPFDYRGGHVGFLGYEVRHDTERLLHEQEHGSTVVHDKSYETISDASVPTAAFLWASRSLVYHHDTQTWYVMGLQKPDESLVDLLEWMFDCSRRMSNLQKNTLMQEYPTIYQQKNNHVSTLKQNKLRFVLDRTRATYNNNFKKCIEHINEGNSYELCLTNKIRTTVKKANSNPFDLYKILRNKNPAPHAAFFNWNGNQLTANGLSSFAICSSSPERFLSVKKPFGFTRKNPKLLVEAKPIKGTVARVIPNNGQHLSTKERLEDNNRAQWLQKSKKDRAENLMIVDLLRNDMSRVCEPGSIYVETLMGIETFQTVHQMVSTIRGSLNLLKANAIDLLKACFPGGSMTGAPKLRTMEILNDLERNVCRGPYSGSLGYISVNGCMDMNILIRTAVLVPTHNKDEWDISIGAGGAITALSNNRDEYDEMLLKAQAVCESVNEWASTEFVYPTVDYVLRRNNSTHLQALNLTVSN